MRQGYIKLFREIMEWEWFPVPTVRDTFIYLCLAATWEDTKFKGIDIPRGSAVCSYGKIAEILGFTYDEVRDACDTLKKCGNVTITRHSKFLVISIKNYEKYQGESQSLPNQIPITSQSLPNHFPTLKKNKNIRSKESNILGNDGASYDINAAIQIAETTVPTVRKRRSSNDGN